MPKFSLVFLPALLPAAGIVLGADLALRLAWAPVPLVAALAALALAWGRRCGAFLLGTSAGLLAGVAAGSPGDLWPGLDPGRPVAAVGRVVSHPLRGEWAWRAELTVERLAQGRRAWAGADEVWLEVPHEAEPPRLGERIAVRGFLGRPEGYANRSPVAPGRWRLRVKSASLIDGREKAPAPARAAGWLRGRVIEAAERAALGRAGPGGSEPPGTALVRGLVLGEPDRLPPAWSRGLKRSGLAHVMAVSGLHLTLVAAGVLVAGAWLPRRARWLVALAAVAGYALVVGPRPSLLRAAGMAFAAGGAHLAGRAPAAGNALALVVGLLVLFEPSLVRDLSFGLSATATAGVVLLGPALARAWGAGEEGEGDDEEKKDLLGKGRERRHRAGVADERAGGGRPGSKRESWIGRERQGRREAGGRGRGRRMVGKLGRWAAAGLATTLGAQLASAPLALPAFHLLCLSSPLLNLLAVPWSGLCLGAGLVWSALAVVSPPIAAAFAPALDPLAAPFAWPALGPPEAWGVLPVEVSVPAAIAAAAALALGMAAAVPLAHRLVRLPGRFAALGGALAICGLFLLFLPGSSPSSSSSPVEIVLFDVGQGDSILLRDGPAAVLVDGGGWRRGDFGGRVLLPALLGEGVRRLDAVAVTHPDVDHCGGAVDLLSYLRVDEVWVGEGAGREDGCAAGLAAAAGSRRRPIAAGQVLQAGRWRLRVLHPPRDGRPGGDNDTSLVLLAEAAGRRVLLTGDAETATERRLVAVEGAGLRAEVLKVGHHGSRTSTSADFLEAVAPHWALISAGRGNPYGHPVPEVVRRLRAKGARVLSTAVEGEVVLRWTEGGRVQVELPGDAKM